MDIKTILEIIERPWFKYFVLGVVFGFIVGAGSTYTAVNKTVIQQKDDIIKQQNDDLKSVSSFKEELKAEIERLKEDLNNASSIIEQQKKDIADLKSKIPGREAQNTSTVLPTSVPTISPSTSANFSACFSEVPKNNRTVPIEGGTESTQLLKGREFLELKDGPIVIPLTENGNPIGYIKISLYLNNNMFKIENIVDPKCQQIEDYSNIGGGDKNVYNFQSNDDIVQIRFGENKYNLFLKYSDRKLWAEDFRKVPKK